jgi:uncharacterized membrane protein YoaK (UPF0700 family)
MSATANSTIPRRGPAAGEDAPDGLRDDAPGLLLVCGLAALAGAVDACAIWQTKDIFVSFMSGNTTMLGVTLAHGSGGRLQAIGTVIAMFVVGAALGAVIRNFAGARHLAAVMLAVAAVLAAPVALPHWRIPPLALAMGMLNTAAHAAGPVHVSLTYVTGTLVKLGEGIGVLLCGKAKNWHWLKQAVPWLGMLAGAIAATWAVGAFATETFAALPVLALALAASSWRIGPGSAV